MLIKNEFKPKMAKQQSNAEQPVTTNGRMSGLFGVITVAFGALLLGGVIRYWLDGEVEKRAAKRTERSITEKAVRGMITDRTGRVLALSRPMFRVAFDASEIYNVFPACDKANPQKCVYRDRNGKDIAVDKINWQALSAEQINGLAAVLKLPAAEVEARLKEVGNRNVRFNQMLSLEDVQAIKNLNIPTTTFKERADERSYPAGRLFSHLIGSVNLREGVETGLEGLEKTQNAYLTGQDGKQKVMKDGRHRFVEIVAQSDENKAVQHGKTLALTIDYELQRLANQELAAAIKKFNAKSGGVVVLDAKTGEILALSSLPDYDANNYASANPENKRNYAVSEVMEPGSVMKPFVVAKGIDSGKIGRHTWFDTHPYNIGSKQIKDTHLYPSLSTEGILQKSSNVGTSKIAAMFDNQELYNYYRSIGFGRKTNSGVPSEQFSYLKQAEKWGKLDKAVMSYGYTITANLLQLAQSYTIFTTDGKFMPATLLKKDLRERMSQSKQVIKPDTAKLMREMMISVTRKGGTGTAGAIEGIDVAAKTGTAKKRIEGGKGYENRYYTSFVGFAPAKNPRLIVAVSINEPKGSAYGGVVAGPVFRNVMAGGLEMLGVKAREEHADATSKQ